MNATDEAVRLGLISLGNYDGENPLNGVVNVGAVIAEIDYEGVERACEDWDI